MTATAVRLPTPPTPAVVVSPASPAYPAATARWRGARTIRGRLVGGFGTALLALLASGALGLYTVGTVHRDLRAEVVELGDVSNRLARSNDASLRFVALAQARLLGGEHVTPARLEQLAADADSLRRALLSGTALTTQDRTAIEQVGALQGRIEVRLAVAQAFLDVGQEAEAAREAGLATMSLDTLVAHAALVSAAAEARTDVALAHADERVAAQRLQLAGLFAVGLVIATVFGYYTWRAVAVPLARLSEAARALGRGDLRAVPSARGLDREYQLLTEAFAQMAEGLRTVLRELEHGANDVAGTAEELASGAEETNAAAEEVASAASSIATSAAAQTTGLEAVAAAAARSAARATEVATHAEEAERAAETVTRSAAAGAAAAGQALERMAAVSGMTDDAAPAVAELVDAVRRIGAMTETIHGIARQTNLLALNAAIEAARAGEQGRGFAVVAEEVKKLAADTAQALEGVRKLTADAGAAAARTAERFTAVRAGVAQGDTVIRASSAELERIASEIAESRSAVARIAAATRSQVSEAATLTREIDGIAAAAQENAATSEQVSALVEEQTAAMAHVAQSSQHLAGVAAQLKSGMGRFAL